MPSASALAKLAGMMTLAILRGEVEVEVEVLAETDIAISHESGNRQAFFNISGTMAPDFGNGAPPPNGMVKAVPAQRLFDDDEFLAYPETYMALFMLDIDLCKVALFARQVVVGFFALLLALFQASAISNGPV
ncbi:hypothetical protein D3C73_827190 [compost metagenome]